MCFPVKIAKFLRTPFFIEHLRWLRIYDPVNTNDETFWEKVND